MGARARRPLKISPALLLRPAVMRHEYRFPRRVLLRLAEGLPAYLHGHSLEYRGQ